MVEEQVNPVERDPLGDLIRYVDFIRKYRDPIDEMMARNNFYRIGELSMEDGRGIVPPSLINILNSRKSVPFAMGCVELRVMNVNDSTDDSGDKKTYIVYAKKHS